MRRVLGEFKTKYDFYGAYPFDRLEFEAKYELSAFKMEYKKKQIDYRFDFYHQSNDSIDIKQDFDNCTELCIDFSVDQDNIQAGGISLTDVKELKNSKTGNVACYYYPGFKLKILAVRHPLRKIMGVFLPSLMIAVYLIYSIHLKSFE